MSAHDFRGMPIMPGARIAYAGRTGSRSYLSFGAVLEVGEQPHAYRDELETVLTVQRIEADGSPGRVVKLTQLRTVVVVDP